MVAKREHVNEKCSDLGTFAGRLIAERGRIGLSQADFGAHAGVGRTTQLKYESGASEPGVAYLAQLENLGVDVLYLISGTRSTGALDPELQNLVDAYTDAPDPFRRAAWGALLSPYSRDVERAKAQPGWYRHELRGENDVRYRASEPIEPLALQETPPPSKFPGEVDPDQDRDD